VIRAYELPSLTVVHFDAHLDSYGNPPTRDAIPTFVTDHGSWVGAVAQLPGIKIIQIGMRGTSSDEHGLKLSRKYGSMTGSTFMG
jgi:arginase family enzyme